MPDSSSRDAEIFAEALRLPPAGRDAYLTRACGGDLAQRRRLEELLRIQGQIGDFLEDPGSGSGARDLASAADAGAEGRVGRYRLIEKIGEGGCGVVYLAEQAEPIRRQVAVKIIKPGMDTQAVIARFEAERQALALMDHPGIAKVFDAGETESGRPYFVMELIRGTKITDYCDQHALPTEERLKLFVQVCHAIQHAHQKGIIHRDIKPSNILVTTTAAGAVQPVVIDFGIAKATVNVRLTDKTLFTAVDMLIGTPTYMSPEQTGAASADIDTRSDIYSLGVLLYELLTGTTPFDAGELLQLGIDEVRRAIRETEPLRPSARLSKLSGENLTTVAQRRRAEPPTLIRTVRGDLDWIAMKALEKERARRYDTASDLAVDVSRFLANEAIAARPASAWYRFRKSVARNKLLFGSLSIIAGLLVGGLIVVTSSLAEERRAHAAAAAARRQAEQDKARAEAREASARQVTRFLRDILLGVGPAVAQGRDTTILQEILETTATRVTKDLGDQPAIRAELQLAIARVYTEVHLWPQAVAYNRLAVAGFQEDPGPESQRTAIALGELAFALMNANQHAEAEAAYTEALRLHRLLQGPEHPEIAYAIHNLARFLWHSERDRSRAEVLVREGLAMRRKLLPPGDVETTSSLFLLGLMLHRHDEKLPEAETVQRDVLANWIAKNGPEGMNVDAGYLTVARTLRRQAKLTEAEAKAGEGVRIARKVLGSDHPSTLNHLVGLANVFSAQGRLEEAEATYHEVIAQRARLEGTRLNVVLLEALGGLFPIAMHRGDLGAAERIAREELSRSRDYTGASSPQTAAAAGHLAEVLLATNRADEAERLLAELCAPENLAAPTGAYLLGMRANVHARRGRWDEAIADASASLQSDLPNRHDGYHTLAALLVQAGRRDEHRALRAAIVARFGPATTSVVAARLAVGCLALPDAGADLAPIHSWVETAVQAGLEGNWSTYAQAAKALLEYRRGAFATSAAWAGKARQSVRPEVQAMACALLALSAARQGDPASARGFLAEGLRLMDGSRQADLGAEWKEWIHAPVGFEWKGVVFANALLAEAQSVLSESAAATSSL